METEAKVMAEWITKDGFFLIGKRGMKCNWEGPRNEGVHMLEVNKGVDVWMTR